MNNDSSRNTIIFVVCAAVIFIAYQFFVLEPATKKRQAEQRARAAVEQSQKGSNAGPLGPNASAPAQRVNRAQAAAGSPRVVIDTPALKGSVALKGARIDDLYLTQYREAIVRNSPPVELFRPEGADHAYFADFGWVGQNLPGLPGPNTVWTVAQGDKLAPGHPVVLTYDNGQGLQFSRRIEVDDKFMFTVSDTVRNTGGAPVSLTPYASVQRQGVPEHLGTNQIVHEGGIAMLGTDKPDLHEAKYKKWKKEPEQSFASKGGWIGINDKYWLAALIPSQTETIKGQFRVTPVAGSDIYDANWLGSARTVQPGGSITETSRQFAGAKTVPVLREYEKSLGVPRFDMAVDWGNFWFFTRPIFLVLEFVFKQVGNFGLAILALTVLVKLLFYPLADKSYESLAKMKKVAPQVEDLRARFKDDPAKQQQEMMALYQREKVNPFMGCLPMLVQIPVFYALFKVLTVTIEMRHAPFFGWIKDLSSRDPSTIWNLFGVIPYDPAAIPVIGGLLNGPLHLGVWGIAYGVSMWLSQAMNPPPADPVQRKIFAYMPIIFTFMLSQFAVGLIIYYTWSNLLTIAQQYVIFRRYKVDNPIDDIIGRLSGKKPKAA